MKQYGFCFWSGAHRGLMECGLSGWRMPIYGIRAAPWRCNRNRPAGAVVLRDFLAALRTDAEDFDGAGSEYRLHQVAELVHRGARDENLDGAGKTAAVDAAGTAGFPDERFGKRQSERNPLLRAAVCA